MNKAIAMVALVAVFTSCNCPKKESMTEENLAQSQQSVSLIGKKALLTYEGMTAEVHYISETQIHWKTTDQAGNVAEQKNDLTLKPISQTQIFVNWIEDDGTTVSQIIDTQKHRVSAFLTYEDAQGRRVSQLLEGTFELKE